MNLNMKNNQIFISHSEDTTPLATYLHKNSQKVLQNYSFWSSSVSSCLDKGLRYPENVILEAKRSIACVSLISAKNIDKWWINFEPGLFIGKEDNPNVFVVLCGNIDRKNLSRNNWPLSCMGMNYIYSTEEGICELFLSINRIKKKYQIQENILQDLVTDAFYPNWEKEYRNIFSENQQSINTLISSFKLED